MYAKEIKARVFPPLVIDLIGALGFCGLLLAGFRGWELWGAVLTAFAIGFLWVGARR